MSGWDLSERYFEGEPQVEHARAAQVSANVVTSLQPDAVATPSAWLERASVLLAEPDPGPTPFLIEDIMVDQSITAVVGRWKTTKTYALLDAGISVVTGKPFLGRLTIPKAGPVVLVLEESGRAALWRRLDSLCRGRAIERDTLAELHYAANKGVKLDDAGWQNELVDAGKDIKPRLFIFDPLARLKAPGRDESAQKEYGPVIEFLRHLRTETGAAVAFVQHTGHTGEHMRGTSDLESVWESRLAFKRDANTITIGSEHREAESSPPISYRIVWDEATRTIRLSEVADSVPAKVAKYLTDHPEASANEVAKELGGNRQEVLAAVKHQRKQVVPDSGNHPGTTPLGTPSASGFHDPLSPTERESGTTSRGAGSKNAEPPLHLGDNGYGLHVVEPALAGGHITDLEAELLLDLDAHARTRVRKA
jgi:hypothetical protein